MSRVTIRPAAGSDAEPVFVLLTQFATSYMPRRNAFDRHFPQLLASGEVDLLVAVREEQVVGYALGFRLLTLYANGAIAELQELMVDSAHRGQGIGRLLVQAIVERARATGCVEVTVPTRRARDYYVKLGFVETATYLKYELTDEDGA